MIKLAQLKVKHHDIDSGIVMLSTVGSGMDDDLPHDIEGIVVSNSPASAYMPGDIQVLSPDDIVLCLMEINSRGMARYPVYIIGFPPLRNSDGRYGAVQKLATPAREGEKYIFGQSGIFLAWLKRGIKIFAHPWAFMEASGGMQKFTALFSRVTWKTRAGWIKSKWNRPIEGESVGGATSVEIEINEREQNPIYDDFHVDNYEEVTDAGGDDYVNKIMMRFKGRYTTIEQRSALNGTRVPDTLIKRVIGREIGDNGPLESFKLEEKRPGADHTVDIRWLDHDLSRLFSWNLDDRFGVVVGSNYDLIIRNEVDTHTNTLILNEAGVRIDDGRDNSIVITNAGIVVEDKNSNSITMSNGSVTVSANGALHLEGGDGAAAGSICGPSKIPICPFIGADHISRSVDSTT